MVGSYTFDWSQLYSVRCETSDGEGVRGEAVMSEVVRGEVVRSEGVRRRWREQKMWRRSTNCWPSGAFSSDAVVTPTEPGTNRG